MTAKEIIEKLLMEFQTDKAGLSTLLGVGKSTFTNISRGYTKKVSPSLAKRILELNPSLNYEFLVGKSDEIYKNHIDNKPNNKEVVLSLDIVANISVKEIVDFMMENIDDFEKNEQFRFYKNCIENEVMLRSLEEQAYIRNLVCKS